MKHINDSFLDCGRLYCAKHSMYKSNIYSYLQFSFVFNLKYKLNKVNMYIVYIYTYSI